MESMRAVAENTIREFRIDVIGFWNAKVTALDGSIVIFTIKQSGHDLSNEVSYEFESIANEIFNKIIT